MAQIFRPASNTLAKLTLFIGAVAPLATMIILSQFTRSPQVTRVNVPYEQPVPFSHEHHVNELGIDCRYCHTAVEKSASAGFPPTKTCMNCHQQMWISAELLKPVRESYATNVPIEWTKVHNVPHYTYFNHSIHVNKGVGCQSCHGATGLGIADLRMASRKYPDDASLKARIQNPAAFLPDSRMPKFEGVVAEQDYAPLLAYVRWLGKKGAE